MYHHYKRQRVYHIICIVIGLIVSAPQSSPASGGPRARIKESIICCPRDTIVLDGWASLVPGGEIESWLWDLNGDGIIDTITSTGEIKFIAPEKSTTFPVALQVKDNKGVISAAESATVFVMKSAPIAAIGSDTAVKVGVRIFFEPVASASCGSIVKYEWDLDDDGKYEFSSEGNGKTSKAYFRAGTYRARLKVTDNYGHEAGSVKVVRVLPSVAVAAGKGP